MDTNIVIALLNAEPAVARKWSQAETVLLPATVLGELLYGARRSSRPDENAAHVHLLARSMEFVACDGVVCEHYAAVKSGLTAIGHPIPENDVWVAACCMAAQATLVTRDAHFRAIVDLECEEW